jgi:hypothetical protein
VHTLLLISLVAVVGLAKALTPEVDEGMAALEAPNAVVGTVIAAVGCRKVGRLAGCPGRSSADCDEPWRS